MIARRGVPAVAVVGLFAALTALMTWPQAMYLSSRAVPHQDVFFNMWRLRWFAHAVVTPGARLFDANIFFPEARTLALSDAMLVEGTLAAPMIWAGLAPVLVHNLMMLGAIALSGAAMFALAKYLTGSRGAGVLAGIVFAYAPYRFEHIMHMELQWVMWAPLAFLALHRACDTGRIRYGLAAGACIALQMLSSIYYGIFLATLIGVAAVLSLPRDRSVALARVVKSLAAGAVLCGALCAPYALPYLRTHDRVGDRPAAEVTAFSASPGNYLSATANNWIYGRSASRGKPERHLFPGLTAVVLAIVALLLRVPGRRPILYLLLLVAAFETSLGPRGFTYPFLQDHLSVYRGLRAAARLGIFFLLFLGVLVAYGYQALAASRPQAFRFALLAVLGVAMIAEYRVSVTLIAYSNTPPPVYRLLASQPAGVVAEFPIPRADRLPGPDPEYAYMSTFHWFPLVNGYSGMYPPSYLARLDRLQDFPSERAIAQLRRDTVRYVIVHESGYSPAAFNTVRSGLDATGAFTQLGSFRDANGDAWLYRLR